VTDDTGAADDTGVADDTGAADDTDAAAQWVDARTTFQRVYDMVLGATDHVLAGTVTERA
jgi:hypothetical protein